MLSCTAACSQLPYRPEDWIAELQLTRLYLNPDQRYPGSCILVARRHWVEITDLSPAEYETLWRDVGVASRAVLAVCRPDKLNVATLGNLVPHLHVHVIPRRHDDPAWPQAIWAKPLPPLPLARAPKEQLVAELRGAAQTA
jgi:diadenosine tetraphosphate (Ap4A) HIT family hydrolase